MSRGRWPRSPSATTWAGWRSCREPASTAGSGTSSATSRNRAERGLAEESSVLVIGARGALGSALADCFVAGGWRVIRGAREPGGDAFRELDLDRPETLDDAVAEADVVVNPVVHSRLAAERAVLRRGGTLINVSAQPAAFGSELRRYGGSPRGTVILNAGRIPGLTNLIAAELLARDPDADAVEIATTLSAAGTSGPQAGRFLHQHLTAARRHATMEVPFPAPIGRRRCLRFAEEENGWLGEPGRGRDVACFMCMAERPLQAGLLALNRFGLIGVMPGAAFTAGRRAKSVTSEPVAMWVAVRRGGELLATSSASCDGDYRSTAAITVALAEVALERGAEIPSGCLGVEEAFELSELRPRLASAGIRIEAPAGP